LALRGVMPPEKELKEPASSYALRSTHMWRAAGLFMTLHSYRFIPYLETRKSDPKPNNPNKTHTLNL